MQIVYYQLFAPKIIPPLWVSSPMELPLEVESHLQTLVPIFRGGSMRVFRGLADVPALFPDGSSLSYRRVWLDPLLRPDPGACVCDDDDYPHWVRHRLFHSCR